MTSDRRQEPGVGEWTNMVHNGDAFDVLESLPSDSVHSVITDPPYGLAFMGRDWDTFEPKEYQEWCESWASKAKRVLRPGGHLLAFSGNRTHHRLFSGVEDAGFEIRDTITWHYGSGFPKALDVSKALDGVLGKQSDSFNHAGRGNREDLDGEDGHNEKKYRSDYGYEFNPESEAAKQWDGWKTALKPATEFVVLARKPLSEGTVAENVQEWGTGALNIDGTRIATDGDLNGGAYTGSGSGSDYTVSMSRDELDAEDFEQPEGRYPANVIFDDIEAERLDREVGELAGGAHTPASDERNVYSHGDAPSSPKERQQLEGGGPSRYFYTSKATKSERTLDGRIENAHPTVKPTDLMEWLVKLVTAKGQIVLDPFVGTGTTLKAAKNLGRKFAGIEKQEKWADVARARIGLTPRDSSHLRKDNNQFGIDEFAATGGSSQ